MLHGQVSPRYCGVAKACISEGDPGAALDRAFSDGANTHTTQDALPVGDEGPQT